MKKLIALILIFIFFGLPSFSKPLIDHKANILSDFKSQRVIQKEIQFRLSEKIKGADDFEIPENSIITAEIMQFQREKRWHKSGFIICKLKNYKTDINSKKVDISDKNIFIEVRKYDKINPWLAVWTGVEIAGGTVASCFLPGVDVAYFFVKGLIFRDEKKHILHSAISSAYDNSIFWLPQKGKTIDLLRDDEIELKSINPIKADKKIAKITLEKEKNYPKLVENERKLSIKLELKSTKKAIQNEKSIAKKIKKDEDKYRSAEIKSTKKAIKLAKKDSIRKEKNKSKEGKISLNKDKKSK